MRRRLIPLAMAAAIVGIWAAAGLADDTQQVGDDFGSGGYSGTSVSVSGKWVSAWSEIGESDGPGAGDVGIGTMGGCNGSCLVIDGGLSVDFKGAARAARFPEPGTLSVSYTVARQGLLLAPLLVQVARDEGSWETLRTEVSSGRRTVEVGRVTAGAVVRFVTQGLGLGAQLGVDDVLLSVVVDPEPTTTTTLVDVTVTSSTSTSTTRPTTTTRPPTTTSTTRPSTTTTTAAVVVPTDAQPPTPDELVVLVPRADGVMLDLDPGLGAGEFVEPAVIDELGVDFGVRAEDVSLDLTFFVLLGLVMAAISATRLERNR